MDCIGEMKLAATPLHARFDHSWDAEPAVVRLTENPNSPSPKHALLVRNPATKLPPGFADYYCSLTGGPVRQLPAALDYLGEGDILRINPRRGEAWVMYRRSSPSNSLLLTERCNSWCIMCSQPPRPDEDESLVRAWLEAIPLMSAETKEIGFTGGEPTLLGDLFLELVAACKHHLPSTGLHVLSNGRLFNYLSLAESVAALGHSDLVFGIPLYSDLAWQHDCTVQSAGAFDQTIRGILNLARCKVRIEIRVVLHRYSIDRLPGLAGFVARNLPFVEHVALMGLEPIGFGKTNLSALWVDPVDYRAQLDRAVSTLAALGMNVSIYNHQLCVLPERLWQYARRSISDWKNIYLPVCQDCTVRNRCGGFFHSAAVATSRAIEPIRSCVEMS